MTTANPTIRPYRRVARSLGTGTPVYVLLAVLLVALAATDPGFYEPDRFLAFVKRAAPLVILAAGQYLVIVCGEFDLSVGAIVTAGVVVAAELYDSYPDASWAVVTGGLLLAGALTGLLSGLITTKLRVPSFITTLGMMLILEGAVFFWTGGSPHGSLPEEFRRLGRGTAGGWLPWAVLACLVAGAAAVFLMRSDFGRTLIATGDSERTAALAGVRVHRVRVIAFVLSGVAAALAAVLVGGFSRCPHRRAAATSSRPSPPSYSAASCSAEAAAASSPPWPGPSRSRPCSRCSTCKASRAPSNPRSKASSSSPP